jgi:hypothetical protein
VTPARPQPDRDISSPLNAVNEPGYAVNVNAAGADPPAKQPEYNTVNV